MPLRLLGVPAGWTRTAVLFLALLFLHASPAGAQTQTPLVEFSNFSSPDAVALPDAVFLSAEDEEAAGADAGPALERARLLLESVRAASYPELVKTDIRPRLFRGQSDYFRTRLSLCRFLLGQKMRFYIEVNPDAFDRGAPEDGLRAIMAHELGHILYLSKRKRVRLFGLVCLLSDKHTARFERRTDLEAIARGYGEGLAAYRRWLYLNVPPASLKGKKRNYFSPEEIDAALAVSRGRPGVFKYWMKRVPLSLEDIRRAEK